MIILFAPQQWLRGRTITHCQELVPNSEEIGWQVLLGRAQNLHDCPTIGRGKMNISDAALLPRKHIPHTSVNGLFGQVGQSRKQGRIDQVAAGITEQTMAQIQLTQGTALAVVRTDGGKLLGKAGTAV